MDGQNDFYRQVGDSAREREKQARREKWKKREKSFWKTFLLTENGKPKSGLLVYTFCLSFVFLGVYIGAFALSIETLAAPLSGLPAFWGNLLQSLAAGAAGAGLSALLHVLLPDKRLAFGTHLWLAAYAVAAAVTLSLMLKDGGAIRAMLVFFGWFVLIPVALGLTVTYLLYRRDRKPAPPEEEEPAWRQYTRRR